MTILPQENALLLRNGICSVLNLWMDTSETELRFRRAGEINHEVFGLLDRVKGAGRPFFLFVNYMDAHRPLLPPAPFDAIFPGKNQKFTEAYLDRLKADVMQLKRPVNADEHRHLISQYDGGIAYIDSEVAALVRRLKKLGLYDNTLIVITSDHGETFGRRNLMDHGVSVHQDQVHIPLIVKYPNDRQNRVVQQLASQVDVTPTILDVLNITPPLMQGRSLRTLPTVEGARVVFSESFHRPMAEDTLKRLRRIERAVVASGPRKLILSTTGKREMYDLASDPREESNLYNREDTATRELETVLTAWVKSVSGQKAPKPKLGKDSLQLLKSLGYVQ